MLVLVQLVETMTVHSYFSVAVPSTISVLHGPLQACCLSRQRSVELAVLHGFCSALNKQRSYLACHRAGSCTALGTEGLSSC